MTFPLGSNVSTDLGEGFVVGINRYGKPNYSVQLMDGSIYHPTEIKLMDSHPISHPRIPNGIRNYLRQEHA